MAPPRLVTPDGRPADRPAPGAEAITIVKGANGSLIIGVPKDATISDLVMGAHLLSRAANRMIDARERSLAAEAAEVREVMGRPS